MLHVTKIIKLMDKINNNSYQVCMNRFTAINEISRRFCTSHHSFKWRQLRFAYSTAIGGIVVLLYKLFLVIILLPTRSNSLLKR